VKGYKSFPLEKWTEKDYEVMDNLSILALNVDNNFKTLYDYVQNNDKIKVPENLHEVSYGLE